MEFFSTRNGRKYTFLTGPPPKASGNLPSVFPLPVAVGPLRIRVNYQTLNIRQLTPRVAAERVKIRHSLCSGHRCSCCGRCLRLDLMGHIRCIPQEPDFQPAKALCHSQLLHKTVIVIRILRKERALQPNGCELAKSSKTKKTLAV